LACNCLIEVKTITIGEKLDNYYMVEIRQLLDWMDEDQLNDIRLGLEWQLGLGWRRGYGSI